MRLFDVDSLPAFDDIVGGFYILPKAEYEKDQAIIAEAESLRSEAESLRSEAELLRSANKLLSEQVTNTESSLNIMQQDIGLLAQYKALQILSIRDPQLEETLKCKGLLPP